MSETGHNTLIFLQQGGAIQTVAAGGLIDVKASGGLKVNGAVVDPANTPVANSLASTSTNKIMAAGTHSTTAPEGIANTLTIATGLTTITSAIVQVLTASNAVATTDAVVTWSGGNLTVADGSTYNTVSGQIINWFAFGA
jgi:hypothetical protein